MLRLNLVVSDSTEPALAQVNLFCFGRLVLDRYLDSGRDPEAPQVPLCQVVDDDLMILRLLLGSGIIQILEHLLSHNKIPELSVSGMYQEFALCNFSQPLQTSPNIFSDYYEVNVHPP